MKVILDFHPNAELKNSYKETPIEDAKNSKASNSKIVSLVENYMKKVESEKKKVKKEGKKKEEEKKYPPFELTEQNVRSLEVRRVLKPYDKRVEAIRVEINPTPTHKVLSVAVISDTHVTPKPNKNEEKVFQFFFV